MKSFFQLILCLLSLCAIPGIVRAFSSTHYIGSGYSMSPVFSHGEVLDVYGIDYKYLRAGRTVAFQIAHDGITEIVAHRLVRMDEHGEWITRGDNNKENDPWRVTSSNYLGVAEKTNGQIEEGKARIVGQRLKHVYVLDPWTDYSAEHSAFGSMIPAFPTVRGGGNNPPMNPRQPAYSAPDSGETFLFVLVGVWALAMVKGGIRLE